MKLFVYFRIRAKRDIFEKYFDLFYIYRITGEPNALRPFSGCISE